jgi:PAS domain S-box-containing protein
MTREEMHEKQTVLIIDDNESNCRSLALILEGRGYEAETAETGAAALEKAQRRFFDLALVDIKLPDIEGIELIGPLKKIRSDIAVIMVTAFGSMETAVRAMKEGALGYITKPFNMDEMLAAVNQTLDKQRLVIENRKLYKEAHRELAERRRLQGALRESEKKHRELIENLADIIYLVDTNGVFSYISPVVESATGYRPSEVIGRPFAEFIYQEDLPRTIESFQEILSGDSMINEHRIVTKSGEVRSMRASSRLVSKGHSVVGVHGVLTDITDHKRAQEEQRHMQEELNLASRLASVGQLASGVAHEINNPLSAVIGFSELLMSRDVNDETKQDLQIINESAQRVARIVKNLLVFARRSKSGREYADINSILSAGLELRAYEMHNANIELVTRLHPRLPWTVVDIGRIQQVFLNIILNAEQAMLSARGEGRLLVTTKLIDGSIRVSFQDNGPGISPENLNMVFDPFFTTKAVGEGTGLGLSICYGIMKEHHGKISVQSKPGKGAIFTLELPLIAETQQSEPPAPSGDERARTTGAKVMVVDDEAGVREIIDRALTAQGHSVDAMDNASAALERLEHEPYHLVLLDIRMPGMDGVEFYGHLKKLAPSLARRVLFMTGDSMSAGTADFLSKTKVPFMHKPFGITELRSKIDHILSGRAKPGGVRPRTRAGLPVDQVKRG